MTAEQFCLKWNNHQSTLISVFDGLFESGTLVDCTLAADGQYIKAHKVVLCACSPYLEALLSEHYNQHPIVILKDVKFEELQSILEYMYRGQVNVTQEQLGHFLKAAEMLQVKGLSENRSGAASAQIVSTKFSAVINNEKNSASVGNTASVAKPPNSAEAARKKEKVVVAFSRSTPSASPVESLLPSKLVIDIPPISPVDSKDASVSPKRKKVPHSGDIVKSDVKIGSVESASECAMNEVDDARLATATTASGFMFGVDPMITEFTAHNIKVEEYSDDSYDSDMLVVDEENAAARGGGGVKEEEQPGPSGGAVADGWKAPEGEDPEAAKVQSIGDSKKPFHCDRCGKAYSHKSSVFNHQNYECGQLPKFECPHCYKKFHRKGTEIIMRILLMEIRRENSFATNVEKFTCTGRVCTITKNMGADSFPSFNVCTVPENFVTKMPAKGIYCSFTALLPKHNHSGFWL
ncbi:zinc finger and BTB domain-containing protein 17 isoform X5 [Nilaparvata lugens]|uniref:zinc finger and BTB domain-containing protein 17 isoform X5 n=1 Tax=Nilaparvata lugens TaxID=108931 RepID=UPI00193E4985|nr:zinc finger and BTB domain-containing protein 17 isoform X5 [Nilaparvata lugens]